MDQNAYFEDFAVGYVSRSDSREVTSEDIDGFGGLTGDRTPIHDKAVPEGRLYEKQIAHGALVFSLAIGLSTQLGNLRDTILALYRVDGLRFVRPVFAGDSIHIEKKVVEAKELGSDRGLVIFATRVMQQDGERVALFRDQLLIRRRPPQGA
jgi:acyl dehydratase